MTNDSPIEDTELSAPPVNLAKASDKEIRNIPLTSTNAQAVTAEMVKRDGMVMIKINSTDRDKHAVPIGLNGKIWNVPRDIWTKVPAALMGILDNAKIREYTVKADPTKSSQAEVTTNDVARFAVSSKSAPADEVPIIAGRPTVVK